MGRTLKRKENLFRFISQADDSKDDDAFDTSGSISLDPSLEYFDFSFIE